MFNIHSSFSGNKPSNEVHSKGIQVHIKKPSERNLKENKSLLFLSSTRLNGDSLAGPQIKSAFKLHIFFLNMDRRENHSIKFMVLQKIETFASMTCFSMTDTNS